MLRGPSVEAANRFQLIENAVDHSIASPSQKLERLRARCSRTRVELFTEHLASSKQANLNCLLRQFEAAGGFSSAHVLDFPDHENRPVCFGQPINSLLQEGNRLTSQSFLLGIWI